VDFALSEQQEMLQTMARDFLTAEYPEKVLRAMVADDKGYTPELWGHMAGMNLMGLSLPEEYGGVGDFLDLAVVLEEMGRACFLTPFFTTVVLGAGAIMAAGSQAQKQKYLPGIAAGDTIVTVALAEDSARYSAEAGRVRTTRRGDGFIINGRKLFVPDAQVADYIVCVARTGEGEDPRDGITLFMVDKNKAGLKRTPLKNVSGEKQSIVDFDNVEVGREDVLGEIDRGWLAVEKVIARAAVGRCAEMVGICRQVLKITLDYAKERVAFGHPIGAFQAIQHRCADMLVDTEGAGFATYRAAWRLSEGLPAEREVAAAKAWVGQACRRVCASAHQVHGAIGFTHDHVLHLYTRRANAAESSFGDTAFYLEKLAELG
jgi:alkylation response protein AidB-like acyl-CoA dehydrogenase